MYRKVLDQASEDLQNGNFDTFETFLEGLTEALQEAASQSPVPSRIHLVCSGDFLADEDCNVSKLLL